MDRKEKVSTVFHITSIFKKYFYILYVNFMNKIHLMLNIVFIDGLETFH